jgi:hypothetical protein
MRKEASRKAPKILENYVNDSCNVFDGVRGKKQPKSALKQIVHVSDDEGDVEQRKEVSDVLDREDLVQQRFVRLVVRLIVLVLSKLLCNSFGSTESNVTWEGTDCVRSARTPALSCNDEAEQEASGNQFAVFVVAARKIFLRLQNTALRN